MATAVERPTDAADRELLVTTTCFAVVVLLHNGDHVRRGADSVSTSVFSAGTAAVILEVALVVLVFMRHRLAAFAAVAGGFGLAIGYLVVHFTPSRCFLSDSFVDGNAAAVSIVAAALETAASIGIGVAGLRALQRDRWAVGVGGATQTLGQTLRNPVVAAMVVGNAAILVVSAAGRA